MKAWERKGRGIRLFLLAPFVLVMLLPLVMTVSGSFLGAEEAGENLQVVFSGSAGGKEYASWPIFPRYPTLQSYIRLLLDTPEFFHMFWNSMIEVLPVLAGHLLVAVPAGWAIARYRFRGRKALLFLYMLLMIMPFQITMVSGYLVLDQLKLLDTHLAIILPACFAAFPVFLMVQFEKGIPEALLEAARVDGAGEIRIFFQIGIPLSKAGVLAVLVLDFLDYWNSMEAPLAYLKTSVNWPLSLYLPAIKTEEAGLCLAASVLMLLPALLVFLYGQSYLEQGIQAIGLKE